MQASRVGPPSSHKMLQCFQRTHPILILEGIIYETKNIKGKKDFWPACCRALQPHLSSEAHPASTPETKKRDKMELLLTASVAHGLRMILNCSQTLLQAELVLSMQTDRRRKKLPLKITPQKTQDKQKTRDGTKAWTSFHPVAACNPGNSHNKGWIQRNSTRTRLRQTTNLISLVSKSLITGDDGRKPPVDKGKQKHELLCLLLSYEIFDITVLTTEERL